MIEIFEYLQHFQRQVEILKKHVNTGISSFHNTGFAECLLCFELINIRFMEYINEFHKKWIERTRQSIASWSKQPISLEEKKKQQERLNQQRAIREGKQKN